MKKAFVTMVCLRFLGSALSVLLVQHATAFVPQMQQGPFSFSPSKDTAATDIVKPSVALFSSISPIGTVGGKKKKQPPAAEEDSDVGEVKAASEPPAAEVAISSEKEEEKKEEESPVVEAKKPVADTGDFDAMVKSAFPGALSNTELVSKIVATLSEKGYNAANTLLCTSLCCDELARCLERDLVQIYGRNFNLGGLAGFPFAGNTGFGAMSAHIPDGGYCLLVHGPHVGIAKDGTIGKVERPGIELVDNCCGSAIAASNYVGGITDGGAALTTKIQSFTDFQQGAVQELILPHGKRLTDAGDNRMHELPYALYESQDILVREIIGAGAGGTKSGLALLGGIQINTGPDTDDYFHVLRFDMMDDKGEVVEDLLPSL